MVCCNSVALTFYFAICTTILPYQALLLVTSTYLVCCHSGIKQSRDRIPPKKQVAFYGDLLIKHDSSLKDSHIPRRKSPISLKCDLDIGLA